jgi:sarcosine oxidase
VVIGAGLLGLATASALSQRGVESVVLEADSPGHDQAGSKGSARIFRLGYPDPLYVQMAAHSLGLWHALEKASGQSLLTETGQVTFGPGAEQVALALQTAGVPCHQLSASEVATRFPALRVDGPAFFEPSSGVLAADACLRALHACGSFTLRAGTRAIALDDDGSEVIVTCADGTRLGADVVVNCAGHQSIGLMGGLRCPSIRPATVQQVAYVATGSVDHDIPVFIEWSEDMVYGLPVPGCPLFKVAQHLPGPPLESADDVQWDDPALLAVLTDAVERLLPQLDPTPVATERCLYDNTSDTDFVLDRVGRIVLGCGTSGHGFKFGPLLGEVLADLAMGTRPAFDLGRFVATRSFLRAVPNP